MIRESIADLDELIIRCRNQSAKEYISEAVACYKSGAYRACIVATWIAFTFDFISKIEELSLSGDRLATQKVTDFENIRKSNDVSASLRFEKDILPLALNDFELLSPIEHQDLVRLYEDRNRCAHPSMQSNGEPYKPTAELARYHIRNTVTYFLQRPPVQGKAALMRIQQEISSQYFPTNYELAVEHFRSGLLARAKESLIRNLVVVLTKTILLQTHDEAQQKRNMSALRAVFEIYPTYAEEAIRSCLSKTIVSVGDTEWHKVIEYVNLIPIAWELLSQGDQIKAKLFVEQTESAKVVANAIQISHLYDTAVSKIKIMSKELLRELVSIFPIQEATDLAVRYFSESGSFDAAATNFEKLILPLSTLFSSEQIKQIIEVSITNKQIYHSFGMDRLYPTFFWLTESHSESLKRDWEKIYQDEYGFGEDLQEALKQRFPDFPEIDDKE